MLFFDKFILNTRGGFIASWIYFSPTVGFLSREPLRKTCLNSSLTTEDCLHYAIISSILFFALSAICGIIWWFLPLPEIELSAANYFVVLVIFVLSALVEGVVEPIAILSLKLSDNSHFAFSNSILTFLQKFVALVLIASNAMDGLSALCAAHLFASICYGLVHIQRFFTRYLPPLRKSIGKNCIFYFTRYPYEAKHLNMIATIFAHSVLKQFITSGSGYIMTFTNIFSLKTQAVYDAVERLASLVTRLILTPLEESAAIYFASIVGHRHQQTTGNKTLISDNDNKTVTSIPQKAIITFASLIRMVFILGLVVCVFGVPYSSTVVKLYGGNVLVENEGGKFLVFYTVYIFFMALNGIIECFAFASMNASQIFSHGTFLFFSAVLHLIFNIVFSAFIGASGFIVANCMNTILRIFYNWKHIITLFNHRMPSCLAFDTLRPGISLIILLIFSFILTSFSLIVSYN